MTSAGNRELRQRVPDGSPLERMRAAGDIETVTGDLMTATYLDSSAIVKLALREPESVVLRNRR
jgi:hypothetical protein